MATVRAMFLFVAVLVILQVCNSQPFGGFGGGIGVIGFGRPYGYGYGGYRGYYPPPPPRPFFYGPPPPPLPFYG